MTRAPRRRPDRRRSYRGLLGLVAVAAAFALGVAFGQALGDNPEPGGTTTSVRTLRPLPLREAPRTVTVTVAEPASGQAED